MNIDQKNIAKLIVKLLKGELTDERQKQELEAWLSTHQHHQDFIKQLEFFSHVEEDLQLIRQFDEEQAWQKNELLRKKRSPKSLRYYLSRIAVAALFFIVGGALVYQMKYADVEMQDGAKIVADTTGKFKNDVLPADNAAKLILADGSTHAVGENNVIVHDGIIRVQGEEEQVYKQDAEDIPVYHTLMVPKASFFQIVLPDGTKVWLNAMSKLDFPSKFIGDERRVRIEGEAYFEVAKDVNRPFYVDADGTTVKVLGTHFNVNSYKRKTKTTLVEGRVEVSAGATKQVLTPGELAESDENSIRIRKADVKKTVAWKNGEFYFRRDDIVSIAEELALWYDLDVRFAGNIDLSKKYSGQISRQSKLSETLSMLEYVSDLKFEIDGNKLSIHKQLK